MEKKGKKNKEAGIGNRWILDKDIRVQIPDASLNVESGDSTYPATEDLKIPLRILRKQFI